ncbi:hypothetical protein [Shewanella maritima]|uniref:hypothetical protein n=1 Tax=Shewanella maritima TaxID=2520507 RepID=UPI003735F14E
MSFPPIIDIPFDHRHCCWFCNEPSNDLFVYYRVKHTPHPSMQLPACSECKRFANKHLLTSIWDCRAAVKDELAKKYHKHLAIGHNWTEQELKDSEFSCKALEGFKKSAWMMFTIAKERMNFQGWSISINQQLLDNQDSYNLQRFEFDGIEFPSLTKAIEHYAKTLHISEHFLRQLVTILGKQGFSKAVKLARLNIGVTNTMQQKIIQELIAEQDNLE